MMLRDTIFYMGQYRMKAKQNFEMLKAIEAYHKYLADFNLSPDLIAGATSCYYIAEWLAFRNYAGHCRDVRPVYDSKGEILPYKCNSAPVIWEDWIRIQEYGKGYVIHYKSDFNLNKLLHMVSIEAYDGNVGWDTIEQINHKTLSPSMATRLSTLFKKRNPDSETDYINWITRLGVVKDESPVKKKKMKKFRTNLQEELSDTSLKELLSKIPELYHSFVTDTLEGTTHYISHNLAIEFSKEISKFTFLPFQDWFNSILHDDLIK